MKLFSMMGCARVATIPQHSGIPGLLRELTQWAGRSAHFYDDLTRCAVTSVTHYRSDKRRHELVVVLKAAVGGREAASTMSWGGSERREKVELVVWRMVDVVRHNEYVIVSPINLQGQGRPNPHA